MSGAAGNPLLPLIADAAGLGAPHWGAGARGVPLQRAERDLVPRHAPADRLGLARVAPLSLKTAYRGYATALVGDRRSEGGGAAGAPRGQRHNSIPIATIG